MAAEVIDLVAYKKRLEAKASRERMARVRRMLLLAAKLRDW